MILITEHIGNDLSTLPTHLDLFKEGEKGEVRIYLEEPLIQEEFDKVRQALAGMNVRQDARILLVEFRRNSDPLTLIALSVTVGIVGWQLFKDEGNGLVLGLALVGLATFIILSSRRRI